MIEKFANAKALQEFGQKTDAQLGFGCVYLNQDKGYHTDYQFYFTPENIANFLGKFMGDADHIVLTDVMDNLVCDFEETFIMRFPNEKLLKEVLQHLIPIQQGEKQVGNIVMATKFEINDYANHMEFQNEMVMG